MKFHLIKDEGHESISIVLEGELLVATNQHPNYEKIVDAALNDQTKGLADLFDISRAVSRQFGLLADSERVSVSGGVIYVDGDPVSNALADQILRFLDEDLDFAPLVAFYDRLLTNPNPESVEQLYRWLNAHAFTIDAEGYIIGYKGLNKDNHSINAGHAIVNGEEFNGRIPNEEGSVIEMPRSEVAFDPNVACHTGLHVGTWRYASDFGSKVVLVQVDPRDVVSVPTDSWDQKLRCCRYVVLGEATSELASGLYAAEEEDTEEEIESPWKPWITTTPAYPYTINIPAGQPGGPVAHLNTTVSGNTVTDVTKQYTRPTDTNYTKQNRDNNGRFIKKS